MGVNSLPKTVTRQRRDCDLNPGPSAPESSTLTTRLPSHPMIHTFNLYLAQSRDVKDAKNYDQRRSVSACTLSICTGYLKKTNVLISRIVCMLTAAVARFSSDDSAICYVLPVLVMTSHYGYRFNYRFKRMAFGIQGGPATAELC